MIDAFRSQNLLPASVMAVLFTHRTMLRPWQPFITCLIVIVKCINFDDISVEHFYENITEVILSRVSCQKLCAAMLFLNDQEWVAFRVQLWKMFLAELICFRVFWSNDQLDIMWSADVHAVEVREVKVPSEELRHRNQDMVRIESCWHFQVGVDC